MCHNNFYRNTMEWNSDETYHHPLIMRKSRGHIHTLNSFPHLPWGFTICEKRVLIGISSISSWVPALLSICCIATFVRWMRHYADGFESRRSVKGLMGLLITHRDNAYEHAILEFGILELQREAILRCKSLASASMSKGHPIEPGRNGSFLCLLFPCPLATLSHEESFFSKVTMEARET